MNRLALTYFLFLCLITSCSLPKYFDSADQPIAPDYSKSESWSALPFREDAADDIPKEETWQSDSAKRVDVFYVYPTLYTKGRTWTADIANKKLNKRIDKLPVRLQASIFNRSGRVYVPRYRQANVASYRKNRELGQKALDFAYQDVKRAFEYYLDNYNEGRPIIIASHSQGSTHTLQLLEDFFDAKKQKQELVCAYLVGMSVDTARFDLLKPCSYAAATNCYVTWSSYKEGYIIDSDKDFSEILVGNICVNPISWGLDTNKMSTNNGVLLNLSREKSFTTSAQIHENYLWIKTNTILFKRKKELHLIDYNMFWDDVRDNVKIRTDSYFE